MLHSKPTIALLALLLCHAVQGGNNIAFQRAVWQSSSADDHKCGHLVTDGCSETYWESGGVGPSWIYVDLGSICDVMGFAIEWGENRAASYVLEGSVEAMYPQKWSLIETCTGAEGDSDTLSLDRNTKARFIRLRMSDYANSQKNVSIKEFAVFGNNPDKKERRALSLEAGSWRVSNARFVTADASVIASDRYDDTGWIPASVPGTILGSYVAAGALPDPYFGDQMSMISEDFFSFSDFWYRTSFDTPALADGERLNLNFNGVNWKSEIYVNGQSVGNIDGAFIRKSFDITSLLKKNGKNHVAVLIKRLDHPGDPTQGWADPVKYKVMHKSLGSKTTNGGVIGYDSPTFLASAGWNWLPIIRGRNLGIWNHVSLSKDLGVKIIDPWIESHLNLPDTTRASLIFRTTVANDRDRDIQGVLRVKIGDDISVSQKVTIAARSRSQIGLDTMEMRSPKLWWPNGYGAQNLYNAEVTFETEGKVIARKDFALGIRDLECRIENDILYIYVNGYRILLRGGNWGLAEGMLDCDAAGYDLRVLLHKQANFNMIRNWVGQTGHDEFYEACDRHGILIFDDFWLANRSDGPDPLDFRMFLQNAEDKICRVRSHPSVAFYCGRNESYPHPSLDAGLRELVARNDPSRHYESHSAAGHLTGFGPYDPQEPRWYFEQRGTTFHSELGIIAIPEAESIKAMMPRQNWWPINDMWAVHDYQTPRSQIYSKYIDRKYGFSLSLEQYVRSAQLANMETSKAMFETYRSHQGSGMLLWMSQAAWPSLICQLYDHYFEMTASYYGAKKACRPLHVLYNCLTDRIEVANNTLNGQRDLSCNLTYYDLAGRQVGEQHANVSLAPGETKECMALQIPQVVAGKVHFMKLTLTQEGKVVADNFYWTEDRAGTCLSLNDLEPVRPRITLKKSVENGKVVLRADVSNTSKGVALMTRLKVREHATGERVLPVIYSDNYISLLPGESRQIEIEYADPGKPTVLAVEGWNIEPEEITIK